MKVFVTGGGGFLGLVLVRQLLEAGYEVVTYSRKAYQALDELGVIHFQGDLVDLPALKRAMKGCEAVFHTAAKVGIWGDYKDFHDINVVGTQLVLKACEELQIKYLVFTSSPSVVYEDKAEGSDESLPYPEKFDAYYPQTKAIAEQEILNANGTSLTTCALRPHLIWGPGDVHFVPRLFEKRRKGKLRLLGKGEHLVDTIYVDNAARAHVQALEAMLKEPGSVGGKAYFLSQDEPITIQEFMNRLLATGDLPPVDKTINTRVALFAGWLLQTVYKLFRIKSEPQVTLFVAKQLSSPHWYNISAAKRDFGYKPEVSIDEGMKGLKAWVGEHYV
ncbi:MAG: NAD-dependent epimerase/dehydratase family protein [Roseivirga sp.]